MLSNQCAKRSPIADKTFYTCTYYTNKSFKFTFVHSFLRKNFRFLSRCSFCGSILSYEITQKPNTVWMNQVCVWQWLIGWWLSTEHSVLIVLLNFLFIICLEGRSKVLIIFMNMHHLIIDDHLDRDDLVLSKANP